MHPLSIEVPRSLGIVVINWNIPMHLFLKDCKLKYVLTYSRYLIYPHATDFFNVATIYV